ncbi:hypothetical protein [Pseudomonas putida]
MLVSSRNWLLGGMVVAMGLMAGCSDSEGGSCSGKDEKFFTESINNYLRSHDRSADADNFTFAGPARYDDHTNWWIVPFDLKAEHYEALLSCDGHLELSIRK